MYGIVISKINRLGLQRKWVRFRELVSKLGFWSTMVYVFHERLGIRPGSDYWIQPLPLSHPLRIRRNSSDIDVFMQVFFEREYACLDDVVNASLIFDCGANVGYSAAYFLAQHPTCHIVAVEPDSENFDALSRNLSAYGDRVTLVRAGIWSHVTTLAIAQAQYRDGREWTRQVRTCESGEEDGFEGMDIGSILDTLQYNRISILKMDIEGAEAVVFSEKYESWLGMVDAIAIELHDDSTFGNGSETFFAAINGQGFKVTSSGELTICRRP